MADFFTRRQSIHGRQLAITSSGGLAITPNGSSDVSSVAMTWGPLDFETSTSSAVTVKNSGITLISTDTVSGSALTLSQPVQGLHKEVLFTSSATALTLGTTATTIKVNTSSAEGVGGGSTALNITATGGVNGGAVEFVGLSSVAWIVKNAFGVTVSS